MDTLIIGGRIITETAELDANLAIDGGRIVAILDPAMPLPQADEIIVANGLVIMPGAIDVHTHFTGSHDFPTEELREGTLGAAIGGITTIAEMPHSAPPATTLANFLGKKALLAETSTVDFALWAGLDGRNVDELAAMDKAGAIAFKAFLCSGDPLGDATDEKGLPRLNDDDLLRAMREIRTFDGLIGSHSENHDILIGAGSEQRQAGRKDIRAHALAGPEIAEIEAVGRVATFAAETGARCHVVHVSSGRAAAIIAAARMTARITLETCPHYLILDEEDLVRIGPNARCGPPLRQRPVVEQLWEELLADHIDMLASDHCPYMPKQKQVGHASIWDAGMGLAGIETSVPMFVSEAFHNRGVSLRKIAEMTATAPAKTFGLYPRKGAIAIGFDADLAFYNIDARWTVDGAAFRGLAKWSAFDGMTCTAQVERTIVRGKTVYDRSSPAKPSPGYGKFIERTR
jgi:allantoinase